MADYREISHGIGRWSAQDVARESTPAEQEAERRYPDGFRTYINDWGQLRATFVIGWNECESRYRELLEAAREYRDEHRGLTEPCIGRGCMARLLAAAAALKEE